MFQRAKKSRWARGVLIAVMVLAVLLLLAIRFYRTIQTPLWTALSQAEQAALDELGIVQVLSSERFIGDKPYTVLTATYAAQEAEEEVVIWMWEDRIHMERQEDGVTREQIRSAALGENPAKRLLRITPGVLYGEYVWEVFYELASDEGTRKYYDYYRFSDGKKIETYRLSLER